MNRSPESITLRHTDTVVTIAPQRGAIVTSFRARGRELLYLDQATFNDRSKNVRGGIPLLFPTPGKLENDRWHRAGRSGEMKQHGFARNLAWSIDPDADVRNTAQTTLFIAATPETLQMYPWKFRAQVAYAVEPSALTIDFMIANEDTTPMPFAFGLHPYFLVTGKARARVATSATQAFDNVAKRVVSFRGFDFTQGEVDMHLLDHGSASATLETAEGTIAIQCSPQLTRWVVWSLPGKDFVCLEPWSAPGNALNTGEGVSVLAPGDSHAMSVTISV
jgi:galactose mutarotase-like enzyme